MTIRWQLPEIPAEAEAFAITRVLETVGWTGQAYEHVGAPGGNSSVRKVLETARLFKTVAECDTTKGPAPYAVVSLVDDVGNEIEGPTFTIPTHQAFLWWSAQMPLKPVDGDWLDGLVETFPEDPRVEPLLTADAARVCADMMAEGVLLTDLPLAEDHKLMVFQVIDMLRRLSGYTRYDAEQSGQAGPA